MEATPRRVFISHTAELRQLPEPRSFVDAVEAAIKRAGDAVIDMAYFTANESPPAQLDRAKVAESDVYVLLAGFCYGTPVRDRPELSYTEHEFEAAGEAGIPRLVFLLSEEATGPAKLFRDPQYGDRQEGFRQRLHDSGITVTYVLSPDHAESMVFEALAQLPRAESRARRVWGIPARPARFTGRDEHLAAMWSALAGNQPTVVQALNGMGGVGKTTLALEYAHRHADDYDIAWCIPAEQPDLIPDRLAVLAQALGVAGPTDSTQVAVARLLGELRSQERWLLVFDNAEDPGALTPFLPGGSGHVVITSRNPHWDTVASPVELSWFTRAESIALLKARLPALVGADELAEALGDLPLAIDQAAATLADTGWTVAHYLDLLQHRTRDLLNRPEKPSRYPTSVAAAWQITVDRLAETDPAAVQLITLAAWLAPEPIPLTLFTEQAGLLPEPLATVAADPLTWADLLTHIRQSSIARVNTDNLLLHRIPAALLRAAGIEGEWPAIVVRILIEAVPNNPWNEPATWPAWQALLPHVLVVTDATRAPEATANLVDWLLDRTGTYLQTRGEPRTALPHLQRAHDRRLARLGGDHPETLVSANNLAISLRRMGQRNEARHLDQDTFNRRRHVLGDDHPDTLSSANNLALDLYGMKDGQRAYDLAQDTLRRRRRILGDDHRDTLATANNLGLALRALGQHKQERDLHQDTFDRRRRILGDDHPDTLSSANNLAAAWSELGEHEQARDLDQDTLRRRRRVLGDTHPETLTSANNLVIDLRNLGEREAAEQLEREIARWCEGN